MGEYGGCSTTQTPLTWLGAAEPSSTALPPRHASELSALPRFLFITASAIEVWVGRSPPHTRDPLAVVGVDVRDDRISL